MLHNGQGAATLGLVLGLMALGVPAMGAIGVLIWLAGRRGQPRAHVGPLRCQRAAGDAAMSWSVPSRAGSGNLLIVSLRIRRSQRLAASASCAMGQTAFIA